MTLVDAGAFDDPLVGGIDQLLEICIGQNPLRQVTATPDDYRPDHEILALDSCVSCPSRLSSSAAGLPARESAKAPEKSALIRSISRSCAISMATSSAAAKPPRSEERRVGKEWIRTG